MTTTDEKDRGGMDFWNEQGKNILKFLEVSGFEEHILSKSPDKLIIDFSVLAQHYTGNLSEQLIEQLDDIQAYENFLSLVELCVKDIHPNPDTFKFVALKNMKMRLGITPIIDFTSKTYSKKFTTLAIIKNITDKNPRLSKIIYLCNACGNKSTYKIDSDFFSKTDKYKHKCKTCLSKQITEIENVKDVIVRLKFEDPSETSETSNNKLMPCYGQINNYLADFFIKSNITVGDRVLITGHLIDNPTKKLGDGVAPFFMHIDMIERDALIEYTESISKEEEEDIINQCSNNVKFLQKLRRSIAPNINGYEDCKLALPIQEISGINLKTKVWDNPQVKKQYVHIILSGDPATAKTQLAKFMMKCSPKIYFASGDQSTITGLIGATYQDPAMGNEWTLSAGALALANGGTACIDELNKLEAKEISKLNQVLTDYLIPVDKAKINAKVYTEFRLLGIMNPTNDSWKKEINRQKILQLNLKKAFTTRMTLIFPFFEEDLSTDADVEIALRRQQGMEDEGIKDIFSPEWLKKFFIYAKRKEVIFDKEELVNHKMKFYKTIYLPRIKEFITDVEGEEFTKDEIPSKMRILADSYESLLSGFARTNLTKEMICSPLPHHYDLVDYLMENYFLSMYFKKEQGMWEKAGILMSVNRATMKVIRENMLKFLSNPEPISYDDALVKFRELSGKQDENEFVKLIDQMKQAGDIYEPKAGYYKTLDSVPQDKNNEEVVK
jgi:DNA replicative helicase MCM subunit Mcm2 (Cdc46/Mcm family)